MPDASCLVNFGSQTPIIQCLQTKLLQFSSHFAVYGPVGIDIGVYLHLCHSTLPYGNVFFVIMLKNSLVTPFRGFFDEDRSFLVKYKGATASSGFTYPVPSKSARSTIHLPFVFGISFWKAEDSALPRRWIWMKLIPEFEANFPAVKNCLPRFFQTSKRLDLLDFLLGKLLPKAHNHRHLGFEWLSINFSNVALLWRQHGRVNNDLSALDNRQALLF